MHQNSDNFSMQEAQRLANSPAARQLLELLQSKNSAAVREAAALAAAGNYDQAKKIMDGFLADPQARDLFSRCGGV